MRLIFFDLESFFQLVSYVTFTYILPRALLVQRSFPKARICEEDIRRRGWNSDPIERCFLGFNQALSGILDNKLTPPDIAEQRKCVQQTAELGQEKAFASKAFQFPHMFFFYRSIIYVAKLNGVARIFFFFLKRENVIHRSWWHCHSQITYDDLRRYMYIYTGARGGLVGASGSKGAGSGRG